MKMVYLLRHGKAADRDLDGPDFERTLIERGIKDSSSVGRRLRKEGVEPSIIVSSPAPRALQTARIVAKQLGLKKKDIVTNDGMYEQGEGALLNALRELADEHETVVLVGHNPSFAEFARFLASDFAKELPTCGVVGIRCAVESWKDIGPGTGEEILYLIHGAVPKKTDYTALRKELEKSLVEGMEHVLCAYNTGPVKKVMKTLECCAKDVAKNYVKQLKKITEKKK